NPANRHGCSVARISQAGKLGKHELVGLAMHPNCKITIDGKPASGFFMERLTSCRVLDKEGTDSDSISIDLNDDPIASIPRKGAIIRVWMGYVSPTYLGAFT